jgi:hypothetical protein
LREARNDSKQTEINLNKGFLGGFKTAFDREVETIADILEFITMKQIPLDITINSDTQKAIA